MKRTIAAAAIALALAGTITPNADAATTAPVSQGRFVQPDGRFKSDGRFSDGRFVIESKVHAPWWPCSFLNWVTGACGRNV